MNKPNKLFRLILYLKYHKNLVIKYMDIEIIQMKYKNYLNKDIICIQNKIRYNLIKKHSINRVAKILKIYVDLVIYAEI